MIVDANTLYLCEGTATLNLTSGELTITRLNKDFSAFYSPDINGKKGTPIDLRVICKWTGQWTHSSNISLSSFTESIHHFTCLQSQQLLSQYPPWLYTATRRWAAALSPAKETSAALKRSLTYGNQMTQSWKIQPVRSTLKRLALIFRKTRVMIKVEGDNCDIMLSFLNNTYRITVWT